MGRIVNVGTEYCDFKIDFKDFTPLIWSNDGVIVHTEYPPVSEEVQKLLELTLKGDVNE
jgi:hypothetical protein